MAISHQIQKADVAQRKEQGSSKANTEAARRRQEEAKGLGKSVIKAAIKASPNVDDSGAIVGDEKYLVKSGEHMPVVDISNKNIAVVVQPPKKEREEINLILQKHKERLAYNAAYQRDLRTIKRLGLNCTVKEWREKNDATSVRDNDA